jgi:hypothetical protein
LALKRGDHRHRFPPCDEPLIVSFAQTCSFGRIVLRETLWEDFLENRQADEWAGDFDQF